MTLKPFPSGWRLATGVFFFSQKWHFWWKMTSKPFPSGWRLAAGAFFSAKMTFLMKNDIKTISLRLAACRRRLLFVQKCNSWWKLTFWESKISIFDKQMLFFFTKRLYTRCLVIPGRRFLFTPCTSRYFRGGEVHLHVCMLTKGQNRRRHIR